MRVAIFAAFYPPDVGGYANNVRALAQGLSNQGCAVAIVACGKVTAKYNDGLVRVYKLPCFQLLSGRYPALKPSVATMMTLKALRRLNMDVVNTQTRFYPITLLGMLFAKMTGAKLVHTERGATHNLAFKGALGTLSRAYDHSVGALLIRAANEVIGVSDGACEFAQHLGARDPITVHNGLDAGWVRENNGKRDPHGIIFTGRLILAKGVADLLDAFIAVRAVMPDVRMTIVGDGPCLKELEARRVEGVAFTGQLDRSRIAELLGEHSVFVNPSYSEGLPTSVLEAMAAGLTVVATDVGGTRELIEHGNTGYLVEPGKTSQMAGLLLRALSNVDGVGKKAQERVAVEFTQEKCVEKTLKVYREVIGTK